MKKIVTAIILSLFFVNFSAQTTNLDRGLKVGEILVNGLLVLKNSKTAVQNADSKTVEKICFKNKLPEKLSVKLRTEIRTEDGDTQSIEKELVIPKECKECLYDLPKGIWDYEFVFTNGEIYKKGELKIDSETTITAQGE